MYQGQQPSCPECQRALQLYISQKQIDQRNLHMSFWVIIGILSLGIPAYEAWTMMVNHSGIDSVNPVDTVLTGGWLVLISLAINRVMAWSERYKPVNGQLLIEADGSHHVHLCLSGNLPAVKPEYGGKFGIMVYKTFIELLPYGIEFPLKAGGHGVIWTLTTAGGWNLAGTGWTVVVNDPFEHITFQIGADGDLEHRTWKNQLGTMSLLNHLVLVTTWRNGLDEFFAHILRAGNTVRAPHLRLCECYTGLERLHTWVVSTAPAPIPGREVREAIDTILGVSKPTFSILEQQAGDAMVHRIEQLTPIMVDQGSTTT